MTVVVRLAFGDKFPVLIGDLLVSSPTQPIVPISLPTFKELPSFPKEATRFPIGCMQKLAIVDDRLALGWAGNANEAREAISGLCRVSKTGATASDMNTHLDGYLGSAADDPSGFVGFLQESLDRTLQFGYRCHFYNSAGLGRVALLGTGGPDVDKFLDLSDRLSRAEYADHEGNPVDFENKCIDAVLALTGVLLQIELTTSGTLRRLYGGGYEIVHGSPSGFRKLDSITYAFWHAKVRPGDVWVSPAPFHVISQKYFGDVLAVRSLSAHEEESGLRVGHWFKPVLPLHREVPESELKRIELPSFNNTWLCHYFYVEGMGPPAIFAHINHRASGEIGQLHFTEMAARIQVSIERAFIENVRDEIQRKAASEKPD